MKVCLVTIAKDEGRFLAEWVAHYLSLGIDRIFIFDNESCDDTRPLLDAISARFNVTRIPWPSRPRKSPQLSAYDYALRRLAAPFEWICFFDCDEFLVLNADEDIHAFLRRYDESVGALAVNWLTFGSSGRLAGDYTLVTEAFRQGGPRNWGNNMHIKTIARVSAIESMSIHECRLKRGSYIHPDGRLLSMTRQQGMASHIDHSLAQLNHYQSKSKADFDNKMRRGRAGLATNSSARLRKNPEEFFKRLDKNGVMYSDIDKHKERRMIVYSALMETIAESRQPPTTTPVFERLRRFLRGASAN